MASTDLTRTHTVATADERKKHTFSAWIKLSTTGTFFANRPSSSYRFYYMILPSGHASEYQFYCYMVYNGSAMLEATGTRKFRDVNGWYHIVVRTDTTQGTGADRFRVYINGEQETLTFGHTPDQNEELQVNRDTTHYIGEEGNGNNQFDGSMSHIHFCDGYSYAPTEFGETDSTTGEWKIKTSPSVTYGTNGFFILKDGNSVTDQSGNSNNFTVAGGTLTKTEDNPSNLFVTLNSLNPDAVNNSPLSNGNTKFTNVGGDYYSRTGNIAVTSGKFYAEVKITQAGGSQVGIIDITKATGDSWYANAIERAYVYLENGYRYSNDSGGSWGANTYTTGDIIGVAMDLDNNKVYVSKNGVFQNSGDPTSGSTGTGAMYSITDGYDYTFVSTTLDGGTDPVHEWNFGNGYFGSTQISSAGTNASGIGIFEYDVPTGYTALSTKGLNL